MMPIDVQGHRGCRGLYPENTLVAFDHAIDLGVHTLEMDVVVNKDHQLVVSHEPFFNHEISTSPNNITITEDNELVHNIYALAQDEIESYDVGLKVHPRFLSQKKLSCTKPLLSKVIQSAEAKNPNIYYNIEIKRKPIGDKIYHPDFKIFADLLVQELNKFNLGNRAVIQCFDKETLQYLKETNCPYDLVLLVENEDGFDKNLADLGFTPAVYSPEYRLVDSSLVQLCKQAQIKLIPWTINEKKDILAMIEIGVDGIISDYPDRVIEVLNQYKK